MGFLSSLKAKAVEAVKEQLEDGHGGKHEEPMTRETFEATKPDELRKEIRMISGCMDSQTSADADVTAFRLPDPAGRAGGACTAALLKVLYADEKVPDEDLSFSEVLQEMRKELSGGFTQIPQLSSMNPIDVNAKFDLVPDESTGTRRAVMIGINYVGDNPGELSGCWNDVMNMKKYIMDVHGFEEENIVVLMDDGEHIEPTKENIINAYRTVVADAEPGDAVFLHYSGHGTSVKDENGDEADGKDEALCPRDYRDSGFIIDDDLYDIIVKGLPDGAFLVSLMDCCHSGTILDLPYIFKGDGSQTEMELDPDLDLHAFIHQITGKLLEFLVRVIGR